MHRLERSRGRVGEGVRPAKPFHSDPSHVAGKWGKAALLGMRRHPGQLEEFVGHLGIQLWRGNRGPASSTGRRELAAQGLEPGVHLDAHRITPPPCPPPQAGEGDCWLTFPGPDG